MQISIITPCRNAEDLIVETAASVRGQSFLENPANQIQYIVVDGASTDKTLRNLEESWKSPSNASLQIISEPDHGMYDALVKGLRRATGDVIAYLNAGDLYSVHAFAVVQEAFEHFAVNWLTGMRVTHSNRGALISAKVPWKYDRDLLRRGHYGVRTGGGRFIQQESTFWRASLLQDVDLALLGNFRLAGDQYLWNSFARHHELYVVASHLGGFRFHGGHLSDSMDEYRREALTFSERRALTGYARSAAHEALSWIPVPIRVRAGLMRGRLIYWDRRSERWMLNSKPLGS